MGYGICKTCLTLFCMGRGAGGSKKFKNVFDQISCNFSQFGTTLILILSKFVVAHPSFFWVGEGGYGDFSLSRYCLFVLF